MGFDFDSWDGTFLHKHRYQGLAQNTFQNMSLTAEACLSYSKENMTQCVPGTNVFICVCTHGINYATSQPTNQPINQSTNHSKTFTP